MARSKKPIVWGLFAAGGTFAAFLTPVMIVITGLAVPLGLMPAEALAYDRVVGVIDNPVAKALAFLVIFLPAWHAAHRLRITAHDYGLRADTAVMIVCYGLASGCTAIAAVMLLRI